MLDQFFFGGRDGHTGLGLHLDLFDEEPEDSSPGFCRVYGRSDTSRLYAKFGSTALTLADLTDIPSTEFIQDIVGAMMDDGGDVDFTYDDAPATVIGTVKSSAITYAKIQNVSATDRLLGRSTAGAGVVEEIPCTAAGRALLDDADAAAQRVTLGLGSVVVEAHTANDTLTVAESGSLHTNEGAAGDITLTLPAAAAGLHFYFQVVTGTVNLQIAPGAGDSVRVVATSGSTNARSSTKGHCVHFVAVNANEWVAQSFTGTWAVT